MFKKEQLTVSADDLDARIAALLAEREALAQRAAEEEKHADEAARQKELKDWRSSRMNTEMRMAKDSADFLALTARLDRERADAEAKFWKERS